MIALKLYIVFQTSNYMQLDHPGIIILSLVGFIFIVTGYIQQRFPPMRINSFYGYRTGSSMKSQERWDFAQQFSAKEIMRYGTVLFIAGWIVSYLQLPRDIFLWVTVSLIFVFIILLIYRTEKAIKNRFK